MKDTAPRVSVIINAHAENPFWLRRAIASVAKQIEAPDYELILVCDRATDDIAKVATEVAELSPITRAEHVDFGDLGLSRDRGVKVARGKYVAFLDGDDVFGSHWLRQAYEHARQLERERDEHAAMTADEAERHRESFVLHPEYNLFFGAQAMMHRHIGDDAPQFDAKDMAQFNPWSALAFAPRSVFEHFPYRKAEHGLGFEDFMFNAETWGAGISHRVVPGSVHMIRMKLDPTSLGTRTTLSASVIPRMPLFDRRDIPNATAAFAERRQLQPEVLQQIAFAHKEIGERQIVLTAETSIRHYPPQRIWNDQAWIRDQIGEAKHVVMVDNLHRGGAEKYAIDWAKAIGAVIVETAPNETGVWRTRAEAAGVKVVSWKPIMMTPNEKELCMAMQRALLQCELASLLVCNSQIGWMLVHENAEPLAKRVLAASFAPVPVGAGMELCPPFFLKSLAPNLTLVTDNDAHAERMREYNGAHVEVVKPRCDYAGPSKRSQIAKKRLRVLWAGRGTPEKNPGILPAVAAILEDKADIHVWGDVTPMNGPENLKYRGPFDGFAAIDGSYDVYLITSLTEGMPNTAIEAVMADIPVVGPEIGGLPELVAMHYRGDPSAIAQAVLHAGERYTAAPKQRVIEWRDNFDMAARVVALGPDLGTT